jgi:WD40 repeat protein/serine/threonine protein kinase
MVNLSGRTLGEFILRKQIGEGGYGTVYLAEQPALEREVVVKVLREDRADPEARERFLREARLAAQLRHPYAAQVYASGAADGGSLLWIAMERVQGVSLWDWLKQHGPMSPERFGPFFDRVCEVVHAAHQRGIVHRDLKSSNIMVVECGDRLSPKLLDLGIARGSWMRRTELALEAGVDHDADVDVVDSGGDRDVADGDHDTDQDTCPDPDGGRTDRMPVRPIRAGRTVPYYYSSRSRRRLTPPNATLGSWPYMAPDLWGGADLAGPEGDVYALGVVAYETLTGRLPFVADVAETYYELHCHAPVPPLGEGFPPALDAAIQGALDKNHRTRTASALELASNLGRALRTSRREQLRTSAQQWHDEHYRPGLLWGADMLEETLRLVPQESLGELECLFLKDSQRQIRRARRAWRALVALSAAGVLAVVLMQIRGARRVTEATITQAELDQGRSALLHDEPDAQLHLARAYQRGDRSPATEFMLARTIEPCLAEQARLASTAGRMWSAAFSPDGRQIVTTDDRAAQVWDAQTYRRTSVLFHGDTVYRALYSADGARIVTAGGDGTVKIWDAATGALVRELRGGDARLRYFTAALSPDGRLVAAIDDRGDAARVWDAATGTPVAEIHGDGLGFPGLAFSSDGRWLAVTGGGDVRVTDAQTWRPVLTIRGPRVRSLAFDPTGARLVTGTATGDTAVWDIPSGARIRHLRDAGDSIVAVAYSPDGRLVAAGSRDGTVQVWRTVSWELQSQLNARHGKVLSVEFDRASGLVLAAGADGAIVVAEAGEGTPVAVLEGPQNVLVAHFDPSAHRIVGASLDGTARVWDATPSYRRWSSPPVADDCNLAPISTSDGRFVAVGCQDHPTRVWDTTHDRLLAELPNTTPVAGGSPSAYPAVSSEGDRAAVALGGVVEVYELPGGRPARTIAHGAPVSAVAFAPTGRDLVSGATDGSLLVTRDGGARLMLPAASGGVDAVGFLPDGRVVAADAQRRLRVFDPGGAALADLELPTRVASLRVDSTRLVGIPYTNSATPAPLVDLEHYRVVAQLDERVGRVLSARWIVGGQVLTTGTGGTAQLWDGTTGRLLQTYRGSSRFLADAALATDDLVVGGGADGILRFWDRNSGYLLWTLPAHKSEIYGVHVEGADIVTRGITGELVRWTLPSPGRVIQTCGDHERCAILSR